MGNVINSCPNSSIPLSSVKLQNPNSTCVQCVVSSFDTGTCDKICEDGSNSSVLTKTRTITTQPVGGWTCPPLIQTTSPCVGLPPCKPAVVSTMYKYTSSDPIIDFTITSNNNMYILFNTYILQINLSNKIEKKILLNYTAYPSPNVLTSTTDNLNNDILYLYDSSTKIIYKYEVSKSTFSTFYTYDINININIFSINVTKDSLQNDVIYIFEMIDTMRGISKINQDKTKTSIIISSDISQLGVCRGITIIKDISGYDTIYVVDYNNGNVKKVYYSNVSNGYTYTNVNIYNILNAKVNFSIPMGCTFYNNNLYVSDTGKNCISKINLDTKIVTTIAGSTSLMSGNLDGVGVNNSLFNQPKNMMFFNKVLYVLDSNNYSIRKVVDFIQPVCSSVPGYNSVLNNINICECATGYTGTFNYTDNIISGCNKTYTLTTGYTGTPGNYTCDISKGYGGAIIYGDNSLSGCAPVLCTTKGYTGTAGSCICISGYNGVVTYTYNGTLEGCNPITYTLTNGYTGTAGNYTCDTSKGYEGTVAYGAQYVAVGQGTNTISYSYDGKKWTGVGLSIFETSGNYVAYGNGLWVALGYSKNTVAWSDDGIRWTGLGSTIFSSSGSCVAYGNNRWVAGGYDRINNLAWSDNPKSLWNPIKLTSIGYVYNITYGNNLWVAGGEVTNTLVWSNDGKIWNGAGSTIRDKCLCVSYANNIWVAGGGYSPLSPTLVWSNDGKTWTGSTFDKFYECRSVAYGNNIWVAGGYGAVGTSKYNLAYSNDGKIWTAFNLVTVLGSNIDSIIYGNGLWIASGYGTMDNLASSTDLNTWSGLGSTIFTNLSKYVSYANGLSGCTPKTYTLTTGYTGTAGNYTCDTSKGYEGTVVYNLNSLSGCNLLRATNYSGSISFQINSGPNPQGNAIKSFIITNNSKNINNFIINIKPLLNSEIMINKVSFSSNNIELFTPIIAITTGGNTNSGTTETYKLSSFISIPSNVTVNIYFHIWSKLRDNYQYTVNVTI